MGKKKLNKAQIGTALKPITAENVSDFFSLFSIPQKAITKLITGKYQAPSEAMGIKNKAGAIATDMILDPVNIVGAGAVKATGAYKNAYRYNPFAQKLVNPNKSYRVTGRDAFDDFVESGMVRSYTPMPKSGMSFAEKLTQRPTGFPSFQKGYADLGYLPEKGGVVFETGLPTYKRGELNPVTGSVIKGRHYAHRVIDPQTGSAMSSVPGKDIKVYEGVPNWLMGHKEIKVPKKKQNGGWLDKYDAPKAQNGIEGTMGGLTDQGFDYNGAWGGTMQRGGNIQPPMAGAIQTVPMYQMGGNLPGATGQMYARTGAPSKGPRRNQTDVTDASAQNGAEMKYYQEGLDFKPKNISQDGSKNPKKKKTLILAEHDPEYWNNPDGSFSDRYTNPFMTEAAGIKKYVNKYFPNEDVEVIPTYKQNIKEVLTKSDPNTRLVVMGHSGDKMFGIPTDEFIESVGNTRYENCYAGICYGNDLPGIGSPGIDKDITGKMVSDRFPESYNLQNFNIRSNNAKWVGFAPVDRGGEEGFRDSFFRRSINPEVLNLENQIKKIDKLEDISYDEKVKMVRPINDKLQKLISQNKEYINSSKATDTKKLDYIQYPARTTNYGDPLIFDQQRVIQKKKEGGDIKKDDMGYWNPENWGEPVEIDSNQITMEGVYEPLIGVSDTGDVQYMEPGGEYEFDGESVTEYPIAQSGKTLPTVNVKKEPIYVDDPNDPRLRAYQDSLNLYNKGLRPFLNFGDYEDGDERKYNKSDYKPTKNWGKTKVKKSDIVSDIKAIKDELNWQESKNTRKNLKDRLALLNQSLQTGIYPTNMVYPETYSAALIFKKPVQPVQYKKAEPKKEQPVKKEQPKPVERKQNIYEGSPVYSPGIGSGLPSALIGFANQKGDTTYIKPEDYERFAVPKYAKEYIETKKQRNGGVNSADAQPIKKLDQLLNFTNYNKPTKGGWLDKYN